MFSAVTDDFSVKFLFFFLLSLCCGFSVKYFFSELYLEKCDGNKGCIFNFSCSRGSMGLSWFQQRLVSSQKVTDFFFFTDNPRLPLLHEILKLDCF